MSKIVSVEIFNDVSGSNNFSIGEDIGIPCKDNPDKDITVVSIEEILSNDTREPTIYVNFSDNTIKKFINCSYAVVLA